VYKVLTLILGFTMRNEDNFMNRTAKCDSFGVGS